MNVVSWGYKHIHYNTYNFSSCFTFKG